MSFEEEKYELNNVSLEDVTAEINNVWDQLRQPNSDFAKMAEQKGVQAADIDKLKEYSRDEVIVLKHGGALGEVGIALIVAFAPVAAKITKDLWEKFILPRLQRRFGKDAITPSKKTRQNS